MDKINLNYTATKLGRNRTFSFVNKGHSISFCKVIRIRDAHCFVLSRSIA